MYLQWFPVWSTRGSRGGFIRLIRMGLLLVYGKDGWMSGRITECALNSQSLYIFD